MGEEYCHGLGKETDKSKSKRFPLLWRVFILRENQICILLHLFHISAYRVISKGVAERFQSVNGMVGYNKNLEPRAFRRRNSTRQNSFPKNKIGYQIVIEALLVAASE